MKFLNTIFILIFSFIILSCAKDDDASSSSTTTKIEGTWKTSCYLSDSYYHLMTIVITGTDAVETDEAHSDSNCSSDAYKYEYTYSSLTIEDEVTFTDGTKGHKYSINIQSTNYTEQTSAGVSSLNSASACGYNDWVINTAKDLQGLSCGSLTFPAKNTTGRGMYNLVGNNLFLGGFITTGSYPTSVNTSLTFVKQ